MAGQLIQGLANMHRIRIVHLDIRAEALALAYGSRRQRPCLRSDIWGYVYSGFEFAREVEANSVPITSLLHLSHSYAHRPPELGDDANADPFAVDVYMLGRLIFAWVLPILEQVPDLLKVLLDMTDPDPQQRITAFAASNRVAKIVSIAQASHDVKIDHLPFDGTYPPVPLAERVKRPQPATSSDAPAPAPTSGFPKEC